MDGRVPARIVHDQLEVVLGLEILDIVALPTGFDGLSFQSALGHGVEFMPYQVGVRSSREKWGVCAGRRLQVAGNGAVLRSNGRRSDANVWGVVGVDQIRCSGGDADTVRREADHGRGFVFD